MKKISIPGWEVLTQKTEGRKLVVTARHLSMPPGTCHKCEGRTRNHTAVKRQLLDWQDGRLIVINYRRTTSRCENCSVFYTQPIAGLSAAQRVTDRLASYLYLQSLSLSYIELEGVTGIPRGTIRNIVCRQVQKRDKEEIQTPRLLAIEFAELVGRNRTVFANLGRQKVCEVLKGTNDETFRIGLERFGQRANCQAIFTIWPEWCEVLRAEFPLAKIIISPRYLLTMNDNCLLGAWAAVRQTLPANTQQLLVRDRQLLLKLKEALTQDECVILKSMLTFAPLADAYNFAHRFRMLYCMQTRAQAQQAMQRMIDWAPPPFIDLIAALRHYGQEILNYWLVRLDDDAENCLENLASKVELTPRTHSFPVVRASILARRDDAA